MAQKYDRKEFLKLAFMANMSVCISPFLTTKKKGLSNFLASYENVIYYKKEDKEYDVLRKGFNKRIEKYPAIIALCKNVQGIAEAIKYAKAKNLPVAVKSGGHSMEGFSCNNGGMVINLSLMNKISWVDDETIKVQPACTLAELYEFLLQKNKIIAGGSCGDVGIAGLVLGGGYGILSRKLGLTCDSLMEVTMVDGKGKIRNSNHEKHLLWACKGGANGNFGVVSEFIFKVHPSPETMQSVSFKASKLNAHRSKLILKEWFDVTKTLPNHCFCSFILNGSDLEILLIATERVDEDLQDSINKIAAVTDGAIKTLPQPTAKAFKALYGIQHPVRFKNACAGFYKSFDDIEPSIDELLAIVVTTPNMIFQVNTLGGEIQNKDAEKKAAFPHRSYSYISELQTYWDEKKDEKPLIKKFELVQCALDKAKIEAQYCNYPDINFKNYPSLYYGANYKKLQKIKNKYDPDNVIRHEQSIANA